MKSANKLIKLSNEVSVKDMADWSTSDSATSILLKTIHTINLLQISMQIPFQNSYCKKTKPNLLKI